MLFWEEFSRRYWCTVKGADLYELGIAAVAADHM